jgi:phytoene synthase
MQSLVETLPVPQRLALAYAPGRLREATLGLFALDAHLANLVRKAREPLLTQARLAWWRERLEEPIELRPKGDPLLDLLANWRDREAGLVALVDGWEHLLADHLDAAAIAGFAEGRGAAFAGLAALAGEGDCVVSAGQAGKRWALADLATHLGDAGERGRALEAARAGGRHSVTLPRALRSLTVLDGLARRSLARGGAPLAEGVLACLVAVRLGIVGR